MEPNQIQFSFKILNWNVRGLGDINKCTVIKNSILDSNCDLVCFQETKWSDHSIFRVRQVCPARFRNYITLDAEGSRGGILLAWSGSYKLLNSHIRNYSVSIILQRDDFKFMLTGAYGPQNDREKLDFLAELSELRSLNDLPWLAMGDFNMVRSIEDITSNSINLGIVLSFNNTIEDLELLEVPLVGRKFTWSSKRPSPTFSRLDRVFISPHWNSMGVAYTLQDAPTTASDHAPLIFQVKPHQNNQNRSFKFETFWLGHPEINTVVQNLWTPEQVHPDPIKNFHYKLNRTRKELRSWSQRTFQKRDTYLTRSK